MHRLGIRIIVGGLVGVSAAACTAATGGSAGSGGSSSGAAGGAAGAGAGGGAAATGGGGGAAAAGSGGTGGALLDAGTGSGGVGVPDGAQCQEIAETAENVYRPIDIIWALDTSDSMVNELQAVEANLNAFYNFIAGMDARVIVIAKPGEPNGGNIFNPDPGLCIDPPLATGVCPGGSKPPNYQHVETSVGSNDALEKILQTYPTYEPTLREGSIKYFAVVTDDESDLSAAAFTAGVAALEPGSPMFADWRFFGIFCTGSCGVLFACAHTGNVYKQLVAQTGTVAGDLCGGNQGGFQTVFTQLAQTVVSTKKLACEWTIPPPPAGEVFDRNRVNVTFTPQGGSTTDIYYVDSSSKCGAGGWYYDDPANPTKIFVCPETCTTIQSVPDAQLDILFGCDTRVVPE